ncbi:MAG: diadenylate cyclase CdaA [Endomicrobiales bacterium]|jgi:diadenylate cyclase
MELIGHMWSHYVVHIVDIGLVSYILYELMLLVRGTRAVQIIVGILMLVVITFLSNEVLHLRTVSWLFDKFWLAAVIILAVVFQPEIRSALAQLGSHQWGRIILADDIGFIDEIMAAIKDCSEKYVGALIVIERTTGLRNYAETGTIIDAKITKELIMAIFNTKAPLHDGALVIQNTRIVAASCVLPLSHEQNFAKTFGTRHRAAAGLSEISDALIIVVSEQTGMISIASEGKLDNGISLDELRRRVVDLYRAKVASR